jgi:hypothetical protein
MGAALAACGAPQATVGAVDHMRARDYPISCGEFRSLFEALGFEVEMQRDLDPAGPMSPYVAMCAARLPRGTG